MFSDDQSSHPIQGLPLTWRPFSDLAWVRGDVLTFERWSQPVCGVYYAVDVGKGELFLAAPLPAALLPSSQFDRPPSSSTAAPFSLAGMCSILAKQCGP